MARRKERIQHVCFNINRCVVLVRELEAECVALLCCEALGLPGAEESRGYIQTFWGQGNPVPEKSAQRIMKTADQILKAGARSK